MEITPCRLLVLISIIVGTSCNIVKYEEEFWLVSEHKNRPCREEDGSHRCPMDSADHYSLRGSPICTRRDLVWYYCNDYSMKCNSNNEIARYSFHTTLCMNGYRVKQEVDWKNVNIRCQPTEFECRFSKLCIPRSWVGDGKDDCFMTKHYNLKQADRSDETMVLEQCYEDSEFRCGGKQPRCIPREWVMDREEDCENGEDELVTLNCNNDTEVMCAESMRCILRHRVNDNFVDCPGADDENVPIFKCNHQEFTCEKVKGVGRCIPLKWVRNNVKDCINGDDETNISIDCHDGFKCLDSTRCLPRTYLCDGTQNCPDGSDEVELCSSPTMYRYNTTKPLIPWYFLVFETIGKIKRYFPTFQSKQELQIGFKCFVNKTDLDGSIEVTTPRTIPQYFLHNSITVCANNEDYCFDDNSVFSCARCLDGTIISKSQVCDSVVDCRDLSDECPCEKSKVNELCENMFSAEENKSEAIKFNLDKICNGVNEMENGTDEKYCNKKVLDFSNKADKDEISNSFTCSAPYGDMRNYSASRNSTRAIYCDGHIDCPGKEDECSFNCLGSNMRDMKNITNCFPFLERVLSRLSVPTYRYTTSGFKEGKERLILNNTGVKINQGHTCINGIEISASVVSSFGYSENESLCRVETVYYKNTDFLCDMDGIDCPWLYECKDGKMKLDNWRRCDHKIDCYDKSDEENCPTDTHFYCVNGNPWFIPHSKVGDGRSDCSDRSDEAKETTYSSETEMLKSMFFRVFVWLGSLAIIICNGVVLRKHFRKIGKIQSKSTVTYVNTYLLITLAFSDIIYGFVLLTIGIKSEEFSGKYFELDLYWRSSLSCNMIGIFTVISSQTSMNILVLITALRFYATHFPFRPIKFNLIVALSFVCLLISIVMAVFPLLDQSFIESFHIKPNLFVNADVVTPSDIRRYVNLTESMALMTNFSHNFTQSGEHTFISKVLATWFFNTEIGRLDFPTRQVVILGAFGYYSSATVCFPNLYTKTQPASGYSLCVALYNLCCLLLIVIGYFCIFYRARNSSAKAQTAKKAKINKKDKKMLKGIFLIVLTDILCWLPIIFLSVHSYRGHHIQEIIHPLSTIILLPINSYINPIVYARLYKKIIWFLKIVFCPLCKKCGRTKKK